MGIDVTMLHDAAVFAEEQMRKDENIVTDIHLRSYGIVVQASHLDGYSFSAVVSYEELETSNFEVLKYTIARAIGKIEEEVVNDRP